VTCTPTEGREFRADALIAALPVQSWWTLSAGKGDRRYAWPWSGSGCTASTFPDSVHIVGWGIRDTMHMAGHSNKPGGATTHLE
jgi:hypothetical protein